MATVATIGVYGFTRQTFLEALREADVRLLLDERLDAVDLTEIVNELPAQGLAALLCVERDPQACHRSLIAARLATQHGVTIVDLRPPG